jgi:RNA polymerase sigma-70 factor (ECF subfamily)
MTSDLEKRNATASDVQVVRRVLKGDREAFEVLVRRYSRQVFAVVGRHVPVDAVESVAQEAFVSAFRSLGIYEPEQPFEHWLLRIARRRCCDYWRQRQRRREIPDTVLSEEQSSLLERMSARRARDEFERDGRQADAKDLVLQALGQLNPEDRLLVECIYFEQLPLREVAASLNWSLPKAKVRAFRIRKKLRQIIEQLCEGA